MPAIFCENIDNSASLCVWKSTETEEFLFQNLPIDNKNRDAIARLKLEKRRIEKLSCRWALATLLPDEKIDVHYNENGAPFINDFYLSFSHSENYAAAAVSKNCKIGVDIQNQKSKIFNLYERFLNQYEENHFDLHSQQILHILWGAKEAAYKLYNKNELDFSTNIHILNLENNFGNGLIHLGNEKIEFEFYHWLIENAVLVLAITKF